MSHYFSRVVQRTLGSPPSLRPRRPAITEPSARYVHFRAEPFTRETLETWSPPEAVQHGESFAESAPELVSSVESQPRAARSVGPTRTTATPNVENGVHVDDGAVEPTESVVAAEHSQVVRLSTATTTVTPPPTGRRFEAPADSGHEESAPARKSEGVARIGSIALGDSELRDEGSPSLSPLEFERESAVRQPRSASRLTDSEPSASPASAVEHLLARVPGEFSHETASRMLAARLIARNVHLPSFATEPSRVEQDPALGVESVARSGHAVHVHIGRVEVRAPAARSVQPAAPAVAKRGPALNLSAYLERRARKEGW